MSEEHEEIEQKTPRSLVNEKFSFRDMRQYLPMTLTFPERDVAVLLPHKAAFIAIHCVIILFGVMSWIFGGFASYMLYDFGPGTQWIFVLPLALFGGEGSVFIVWGLRGLVGKTDDGRVIFDRRQGTIEKKARKAGPFTTNDMRIRNVAAIQICSGIVHGSENDITMFQLNLVLLKPAGERIRIVNRMKEEAVRADAKPLANFLDVPLWDHLTADGDADRVVSSRLISEQATPADLDRDFRNAGIVKIDSPAGDGCRFVFPMARQRRGALSLSVLGLMFLSAPLLILLGDFGTTEVVFGTLFGLAGVFLLTFAVHLWFYRSTVDVSRRGLTVTAGLFGRGKTRWIAAAEVDKIEAVSNMRVNELPYYDIIIACRDGRRVKAGKRVPGAQPAATVIRQIELAMGKQSASQDVSVHRA